MLTICRLAGLNESYQDHGNKLADLYLPEWDNSHYFNTSEIQIT
jgi:hypothetical protein